MWATGITDIVEGQVLVRGLPIDRLISERSFAEVLALLLVGRLPSAAEARMVEAVLVASIDHGATSPSALTARTVASGGASPQVASVAGLLALSKYHGATVSDCADLLTEVVQTAREKSTLEASAEQSVRFYLAQGRRVPGFGHRVHSSDPRVPVLFGLAAEVGLDQTYIHAANAVGAALDRELKRSLPMNLDTAIAAVLLPFIPRDLVLPVFMASRFCGIYMQAHEESTRMKPMRRINPSEWSYDGPRAGG